MPELPNAVPVLVMVTVAGLWVIPPLAACGWRRQEPDDALAFRVMPACRYSMPRSMEELPASVTTVTRFQLPEVKVRGATNVSDEAVTLPGTTVIGLSPLVSETITLVAAAEVPIKSVPVSVNESPTSATGSN